MMKLNVKDNYFDYVRNNPDRKIIVYGAGCETRKNYKYMGHIDYMCDQRAGQIEMIEGIPCISPKELVRFQDRVIILICIRKRSVVEQVCLMLDEMQMDAEVFSFFDNEAFPCFDASAYRHSVIPKETLRIRLVYHDDGWILGKFARKLQEELTSLGQEADIAETEDTSADINHYIYYGALTNFFEKSQTVRTTMITHVNCARLRDQVQFQAQHNTTGICMSSDTLDKLSSWGIPRNRICYVNPAQDGEIRPRKTVLGITNRCYRERDYRKRDDMVLDICRELDPLYFKFRIMGAGWEEIICQLRELGFEIDYYDDFDREIYKELMPGLDYWLYFGVDEGAMGYLDALAAGIKTITTPQGYHLDTRCGLTYPCRTVEEFGRVLKKIQKEREELTDAVKDWTWENYARKHLEIWQYLTQTRPMEELYRHQGEYVDGIFSLLIDEIGK